MADLSCYLVRQFPISELAFAVRMNAKFISRYSPTRSNKSSAVM